MKNLNEEIKVFFIDLDGTLLDKKKKHEHVISEKNISAIEKIKKEGKHVVISTGRMDASVKGFMKKAGVNYAVLGNGAKVIDIKENVHKDEKLTLQQSVLLFAIAKQHNLSFKLDGQHEVYGATNWLSKTIAKKWGYYPYSHYNAPMHKQYYKFVFWGKRKSKLHKFAREVYEKIPSLSIVSSLNGWTIEVTHKNATKGIANTFIAKTFFDIRKKTEMAHIGDTWNDSTVVKHMRFIVMGNAKGSVKNLSDYIGPPAKNAGVAKILNGEYINKKEKKNNL